MGIQFSVLLCSVLAAALFVSRAQAADFAGASGMAWISGSSYLCVQDLKSNMQGSRVGILTIDTEDGGYDYLPLNPDWGGEQPHDLESIYGFRTKPGEFLMAESGSYENWDTHEYHIGRIFHVKLAEEQGGWQVTVLGTIPIPENIHEIEGMFCMNFADSEQLQQTADPFHEWQEYNSSVNSSSWEDALNAASQTETAMEAGNSAALSQPEPPAYRDLICLVMASRGGDALYQPAIFYPYALDVNSHELGRLEYSSGQELRTFRRQEPHSRSVSDIYIDELDVLWIASCTDAGDSGPFNSQIYRFGEYDFNASALSANTYDPPLWNLGGVKVEAICQSILTGGTLCYATDDEGYGGIWRSLADAQSMRFP
jgi:hypothetical protein